MARLLFVLALIAALAGPAGAAGAADDAARLSDADALWTRNAFKAAGLGRWKTVGSFARRIQDPLARKLVVWRRLTGNSLGADFGEINQFLNDNPAGPRRERLRRRAEEAMPPGMAPDAIVRWFGDREPVSGSGRIRLGAAHLALGQTALGEAMIRAAWIDGNFPKRQARAFYKRYKRLLSQADHIKRMDRLLWTGRYGAARRMMFLVPKPWQGLAMARMSLRRRTGNVDFLISKVPKELLDHPGLVYERLRWRRRKNKDSAIELAKSLGAGLPYAEKWWEERAVLARRALRKGHVTDAYRIAERHGIKPGGAAYAEAEWLSGWIALRFLNEAETAETHFEHMFEAVNYPVSIARGAYWRGRAAEARGKADDAVTWYRKAADHPLTYYGQLAFARLRPGRSLKLPGVVKLPDGPLEAFDAHELVKVIGILADIGAHDHVRHFVNRLMELSSEPLWWARTARLAGLSGRPDLSIRIAKKADRSGTPLPREAFPVLKLPPLPETHVNGPVEVPLVLAVIRQESAFRITALSHAGARGLMQIMPATAKVVSKGLKMRYSRVRLTSSPKYNLTLGHAYLADLVKEFNGSYVLALAGYNAGPHRARRWIKQHGDPRKAEVDSIDWVEMIPFDETRNYVQRVLENLQIYRLGLAKTEIALGLEEDLHFSSN
ncbi:MAG: lytic transglycosylase domain-containing protein [Magnetovibrio sp.]|nr:lytic transglycosylase domain-containing protein [Magnetovibrio sp.]